MTAPFRPFGRSPAPSPAPPAVGAWTVGRRTALVGAAVLAVLMSWAGAATWYIVFRDTVAARLLAQQAALERDYEDRLGQLRARLDRSSSQKVLEHDALEKRVAELAGRQAQLESRQAQITLLAGEAGPAAPRKVAVPDLPAAASAFAPVPPKPKPAEEPLGLRLRDSSLGGRTAVSAMASGGSTRLEERLGALHRAMVDLEAAQLRALDGAVRSAEGSLSTLRAAVAEAGLHPEGLAAPAGTGGPLVAVGADAALPFDALTLRLRTNLSALDRTRRILTALPFGRPMDAAVDVTSGFGYRLDPFTRGPALHTGLDFRGEHGDPVRATGAGRVVTAEPSGGYGNMVEVDHGHGVTTRYAHLSALAVAVGQAVTAGTVLGRVGSTGRSTGPHLHYETRLHGEAVDPQRFLKAGSRLAGAMGGASRPIGSGVGGPFADAP